ncbi:uncharacterized protein Z518_03340 [Rhinocladiella mackenziei CBS 650.93]|uniref:Methyltransferase type 11 domain-containing protein n=1 Tax=Rhinocladiella mackenziei CBS 650.93 TaxID=1442369 RepID=A0A0D2HDQ2_9EURO|nr:uncharacterized protein Z518_03340 [Rhinocladiella mackenziei CBS 650.93]KIX08683.1 hypothetical protein Z518_03340 [Rhinocladiella mackenziei CBS 650.93]
MGDLATRNREHFDKHAIDHQREFADLIQATIEEFQSRRFWISNKWVGALDSGTGDQQHDIRLLDYACGSGTASRALAHFVTQAVGLDLSQNMVEQYNKHAREMGFYPDRMHARQYDLLAEPDPKQQQPLSEQELSGFDIVVVSAALHHVADPGKLLKCLAQCLKRGGVCVVLDKIPDLTMESLGAAIPPEHADALNTISKRGFSEEEMRKLYEDAGLGRNFDHVVIDRSFEFTVAGRKIQFNGFITRGELT